MTTPELDDEQTRALLAYLDAINPPKGHDCWRELVNGRWCVFMTYGAQTYCLLPLHYEAPASRSQALTHEDDDVTQMDTDDLFGRERQP